MPTALSAKFRLVPALRNWPKDSNKDLAKSFSQDSLFQPNRSRKEPMNNFARQIGERIRIARETKGLTQDSFAQKFGCNDRQTVSAIETGIRLVSAEELQTVCQILGEPLAFFTDPYVVTERNAFSYRAKSNSKDIANFEQKTHKLISANRRFRSLLEEPALPFGNQLRDLNKQSTLAAATDCGERTAKALELGETPALKLRDAIEQKLNVMVMFIDAPESISGAACHLSDGDFVMINRSEASFRRNFDMGHELFHILTWDTMPPNRIDTIQKEAERPKEEKLADAFTAGLLMPYASVAARWAGRSPTEEIHQWILKTACDFQVSGTALYWRLVNSRIAPRNQLSLVKKERLSRSEALSSDGRPNAYNAHFARRLYAVLDQGLVSARKTADLLECDLDEIRDILSSYNYAPPFDL